MWLNPQFPADLVTFTGEILNGNLIFCAVNGMRNIENLRINVKNKVLCPVIIWYHILLIARKNIYIPIG